MTPPRERQLIECHPLGLESEVAYRPPALVAVDGLKIPDRHDQPRGEQPLTVLGENEAVPEDHAGMENEPLGRDEARKIPEASRRRHFAVVLTAGVGETTWEEALARAATLNTGGNSDWRRPIPMELFS